MDGVAVGHFVGMLAIEGREAHDLAKRAGSGVGVLADLLKVWAS